jgi:Flp pilus assembly protein TadD
LFGIAVLLAPTAGCATFPFSSHESAMPMRAPSGQAAAPNATIANPPTDLGSAIRDAQAVRRSGDLAGAARALSQLVLIAPDDARVVGEYGKTLAAQGRSDDALAFLERAIQLEPGDWTLFSAQGIAYDQKGSYQAAQASYTRALALKPGEPAVLNNDALSHVQSGDLDGAEKLLREASPFAADFPRIAENLAFVQSLKSARPVQPMAAAAAPPVAAAAVPAPAEQVAAPSPAPVSPVVLPPPTVVPAAQAHSRASADNPVKRYEPSLPDAVAAAPRNSDHLSAIERLKADPTVRMAPIPKPDAVPALRAGLAKAESAEPAKLLETKPAAALIVAKPAGPGAPAQYPAPNALYVQAGAYLSEARAGQAASTLDSLGAHVMSGVVEGRPVYRVRIGPFLNMQQAKAAITQAQALWHADLQIVKD